MTTPPAGWYQDPMGAPRQRYWDGQKWADLYQPLKPSGASRGAMVAIGVCLLIAVGFVMSLQSVTLMTGSTLVWTGVAVVAAGTAGAFILRAPLWVRIVAVIVLALALVNAIYIESELSDRRDEFSRVFDR